MVNQSQPSAGFLLFYRMITESDYWKDRKDKYPSQCTPAIQANASRTVKAVNLVLSMFEAETGLKRERVASGWRPAEINDATANAAKSSTHLTGEGCDVHDPDRALAAWCVVNINKVATCGLWIENPMWTFSPAGNHWVHFQTKPPKSGKRIYIPSAKPPIGPALPGLKPLPLVVKV